MWFSTTHSRIRGEETVDIYFIRKLNIFHIDNKIFSVFCKSLIENILCYWMLLMDIIGVQQTDLYHLYPTRLTEKEDKVWKGEPHTVPANPFCSEE